MSFGLPSQPMQNIANENEILQAATGTLQDNFTAFELSPPSIDNLELVEGYNGTGTPPSSFTYQNTPEEIFWFIHGLLFLL